jgi:hypothetical protein
MEKGVIGGMATLAMKNNFVFELDDEKFEQSSIFFDYTYRKEDEEGDEEEEGLDQFENEEEDCDECGNDF